MRLFEGLSEWEKRRTFQRILDSARRNRRRSGVRAQAKLLETVRRIGESMDRTSRRPRRVAPDETYASIAAGLGLRKGAGQ